MISLYGAIKSTLETHLQDRVGLLGDGLQVVHGGLGGDRGSGSLLGRSEGGSRGDKGGKDSRLHFQNSARKSREIVSDQARCLL